MGSCPAAQARPQTRLRCARSRVGWRPVTNRQKQQRRLQKAPVLAPPSGGSQPPAEQTTRTGRRPLLQLLFFLLDLTGSPGTGSKQEGELEARAHPFAPAPWGPVSAGGRCGGGAWLRAWRIGLASVPAVLTRARSRGRSESVRTGRGPRRVVQATLSAVQNNHQPHCVARREGTRTGHRTYVRARTLSGRCVPPRFRRPGTGGHHHQIMVQHVRRPRLKKRSRKGRELLLVQGFCRASSIRRAADVHVRPAFGAPPSRCIHMIRSGTIP